MHLHESSVVAMIIDRLLMSIIGHHGLSRFLESSLERIERYDMFEGIKESVFAEQLKTALDAHHEASRRLDQAQAELKDCENLVHILLAAIKLQ